LLDIPGVTISENPSEGLNYFFPYLNYIEPYKGISFFTHREGAALPKKQTYWDYSAKGSTSCVSMSAKYAHELREFGGTDVIHIRPPVDKIFYPRQRLANNRPVIGFCGQVYNGGRKGEHLAYSLSCAGLDADFVAAGVGWQINSFELPFGEMPDFYGRIDLFVCTSLIEGGPMPVLEALASGVRVVVPSGVGIIDELPDLPDIVRYKAGDFKSLCDAVCRAMHKTEETKRDDLHSVTLPYNIKNYISQHIELFERLS
jgi:glycosyltransferase involved in cell wall biosynthesis